jgi:hypothetical protein
MLLRSHSQRGCPLVGHLFRHLLFHFLGCGSGNVASDHPNVTLGIHNGSTPVAPEHIHHGSLGRGAELYGVGNRLVRQGIILHDGHLPVSHDLSR